MRRTLRDITLSRCLGSEDRVEVGVGELLRDGHHEELDGRGVGNVQEIHIATTARDETTDTPTAINDDGAGIALAGEGAGLLIVRKNRPFLGNLFLAFNVVTDEGEDVVTTTDGQIRGISSLQYHETRLAVLVDYGWAKQLSSRNSTLEDQEVVGRILGAFEVRRIGVHHAVETFGRKLSPEVDDVSFEVFRVDLGGIELDDGKILCILNDGTDPDGRAIEDMAQDAVLCSPPVLQHYLTVEWILPQRLFRLINCSLSILALPLDLLTLHLFGSFETSFLMLNRGDCIPNLHPNRGKEFLERTIAEEEDIMTGLSGMVVLVHVVVDDVRGETT